MLIRNIFKVKPRDRDKIDTLDSIIKKVQVTKDELIQATPKFMDRP